MLLHPTDSPRDYSIIGGMFGLELGNGAGIVAMSALPKILTTPSLLLLATARSAFALLAKTLRPSTIWLPSYLCGVVVRALSLPFLALRYYPVDENLMIFDDTWLASVREGDIVVFIDYFGFNFWNEYGGHARQRGAWVVEDACQAMLNSSFSEYSHYIIASPRKFVGVPDGGILVTQAGAILPDTPTATLPIHWWLQSLQASVLRAEFDKHGGERRWFQLFQTTEAACPFEPMRMSELSSVLLLNVVNWSDFINRRRENYYYLANALSDIVMFPELPDGVVPLGFPVRLRERDGVRQAFFNEEIYPVIHWPLDGIVPLDFKESHALAQQILTLSCDQRYDEPDLERMIAVIRKPR